MHISQLTKNFQSAHFVASHGKGSNFYSKLVPFEHTYHIVVIGESYVSDTACAEITKYISKSIKIKNIAEPLNNGESHYSLSDGSSSAKMMDGKALFLIKRAFSRTPKFSTVSLQEAEDTNTECLKVGLKNQLVN